jgi:acetolactate synthase I/II/III large subunit
MPANEMTGGEALARMIKAHEGGPMFGMGGFQLLPFYDAARRLSLTHHLINDERAAVFAADAYAKVSGRVGLADATLGPGATNLVTGLVEALNAGSPIVVLTGDTHRDHSWKNMTQESRQLDILRPAVKDVLRVESPKRIPELMRRAFAIATTGRPGPVIVDVPEDVCHGLHGYEDGDFTVDEIYVSAPALRCRPDAASLERAARLLAEARRPILLAGGGVHISQAAGTLTAFAEAINLPVAHTMTGKGAVACTSPLSAGLFGRYDRIANTLIQESDLIFVAGCKLGEIATKRFTIPPRGKRIVHLDIVPEEIGRTVTPELALWGDVREGLRELHAALAADAAKLRARQADYANDVGRRMAAWRASVAARLNGDETPVGMARLINELNAIMPADGVLVADGGFAAHWGGLLYDTKRPGRGFVPDRLRPARRDGRSNGSARPSRGQSDGRRRLQHDARRAGNGAQDGTGSYCYCGQQRGIGVCEGAAACDVRPGCLPCLRSVRDELCCCRRGAWLSWRPCRETRGTRRRAAACALNPGSKRRRRGGHPRSRQDAARGRQSYRPGQEG